MGYINNMNNNSRVLISDFDGTISKTDFFYFAIDNLLTDSDLKPWSEYEQGKLSHVDALSGIFSKIRLPVDEFHKFILELPIEESFVDTVNYCYSNKIGFYILSAGADYYIKVILEYLGLTDKVHLICNKSVYSYETGLNIINTPQNNPFYCSDYGVSKRLAVETIKKDYNKCIFAGDGNPDIEGAKLADVVFARGVLVKLCKKYNIDVQKFDSYSDILEYLKNE